MQSQEAVTQLYGTAGYSAWYFFTLLFDDWKSFLVLAGTIVLASFLNTVAIVIVDTTRDNFSLFIKTFTMKCFFYVGLLILLDCVHLYTGAYEIKLLGNLANIYSTGAFIILLKEVKSLLHNLVKLEFDLKSIFEMVGRLSNKLERRVEQSLNDKIDIKEKENGTESSRDRHDKKV